MSDTLSGVNQLSHLFTQDTQLVRLEQESIFGRVKAEEIAYFAEMLRKATTPASAARIAKIEQLLRADQERWKDAEGRGRLPIEKTVTPRDVAVGNDLPFGVWVGPSMSPRRPVLCSRRCRVHCRPSCDRVVPQPLPQNPPRPFPATS